MATVKYRLRSDKTKTVDVISPIYGIATIVGSDGKKSEMRKDEFNQLYEPVLAAPNLAGVDMGRPGGGNNTQALADIQESLSDLHAKVDELRKVILPPTEEHTP